VSACGKSQYLVYKICFQSGIAKCCNRPHIVILGVFLSVDKGNGIAFGKLFAFGISIIDRIVVRNIAAALYPFYLIVSHTDMIFHNSHFAILV
jgi:hypothetical protein